MGYVNNPAQRLEYVLNELRNFPAKKNASTNYTIADAIASKFTEGDVSTPVLTRMVADIAELPGKAAAAISAANADDYYLQWKGPVDAAIGMLSNLGHPVAVIANHVDEASMMNLGAAVRQVVAGAPVDDGAEIAELASELEALYEAICGASLPEALATFLCDQVDRMRVALRDFRIVGSDGITDAADAAVGAVLRARGLFPDDLGADESRGFAKQVFVLAGKLGEFAGKAGAVIALSEKAYEALMALPPS
uniref:hypothetical protein n=1 Tax=Gordonia sp. B7-2 TaxID=3420932 RepID=UPI003D8CF1AA